jgi:hypothetical protein
MENIDVYFNVEILGVSHNIGGKIMKIQKISKNQVIDSKYT